nr:CapE family protein [Priestia taiwanensis]
MNWLVPVVLVVSLLVIMGNLKRTEQLTPEEAEKIGELTRGVEQKRVVRSTE